MPTTTEQSQGYLREHPSIKDCLKKGVINYSRLARRIAKDLDIEKDTSMEAILIACRRYAEKLKGEPETEEKIRDVVRQSEVTIKNRIATLIVDKRIYVDHLIDVEKKVRKGADTFYAIEGVGVYTVIVSERYVPELKKLFSRHILHSMGGLSLIILKTSEDIEFTPGVNAFLYSIFSEHGINIVETMSCWTDTIFVIEDKDVPDAMQFLRF
ncbi:MAG: hypothetical protein ABIC95_02545 [archaeon]